jgi:hypothetical protein
MIYLKGPLQALAAVLAVYLPEVVIGQLQEGRALTRFNEMDGLVKVAQIEEQGRGQIYLATH